MLKRVNVCYRKSIHQPKSKLKSGYMGWKSHTITRVLPGAVALDWRKLQGSISPLGDTAVAEAL